MRSPLLAGALLLMSFSQAAHANTTGSDRLMAEIAELQEAGKLNEADALVESLLSGADPGTPFEKQLRFELERSQRISRDYSMTRDRLYQRLVENIEGVTQEEFEAWIEEGRFDRKFINGEERFVGAVYGNTLMRHHDIAARRITPKSTDWEDFLLAHMKEVHSETGPGDYLGEPRRFEITMTITLQSDVVPEGESVRVWMPYPQVFQSATGVELLSADPAPSFINAPNYPTRSLYFEVPSKGAEATAVSASYTLTTLPRRVVIDHEIAAQAADYRSAEWDYFTAEKAPHVMFTPEIKALAAQIKGDETNPAIIARKTYDWISENIVYSYAREYSTLRNISMYCLENGYGDCGQITLLYMTLCRANGIPARWQSGWIIYPNSRNLHDWCEIYIAPYGWIPVDANYGLFIEQSFRHMSDEDRKALKDFYFGGMDAYRLIVNSDHGHPHFPAKEHFRSDDVDFQRGEVETDSKNIYFGDFRYRLELKVLDEKSEELSKIFPDSDEHPAMPAASCCFRTARA